jgi:hypothetical protein
MENWIFYLIGIFVVGFVVGFIVVYIFIVFSKKWNSDKILMILVAILVVVGIIRISQGYTRHSWLVDTIINNANK